MNQITSFLFFTITQYRAEGFIALIILICVFVGAIVWYQFILKPKELKEFNNWLEENKQSLKLKYEIKNILNQLSKQCSPCSKCSSIDFQIWDISSSLTLRCCNCKRKEEHSVDTVNEIKNIFDVFIMHYREYNFTKNSEIKNYLKNYLEWNFESVRKGTSLYTVFQITALNLEEKIKTQNPNQNKSRLISQTVKNQVWNRDNGKCVECGSNEKLEFDHIIPFSKGGSNTYRNIQLLCENCNRTKSDKIG